MYKLIIEEKEYQMPSGWDEVTLKSLLIINKCLMDDKKTKMMLTVDLISSLSGLDKEIVYQIKLSDINQIDFSWMNTAIDKTLTQEIEIDGITYSMVDVKNMSLGEYVDLDMYMQNIYDNLHYITAILIRPIVDGEIEKYNTKTLENRAKLFYDKMKVSQILGVTDFFQNGVNKS